MSAAAPGRLTRTAAARIAARAPGSRRSRPISAASWRGRGAYTPAPAPVKLSWWVSGDTNAFFGLGFNTLVNVLVLSGLCLGVINIPGADVFGVILPALGVQLLIGSVGGGT